MAKDVTSAGALIVGDLCRVAVSKGSKKVTYNATLVGEGKYTNSTVLYILVYKLCTSLGSEREMEYSHSCLLLYALKLRGVSTTCTVARGHCKGCGQLLVLSMI